MPQRLVATLVLLTAFGLLHAQQRPNILLVTLDTVRADRMGFLGSTRGATPALDAFAKRSVVFERAYAQAPVTTVSHATILSGTFPPFHSVSNFGSPLPDRIPYLSGDSSLARLSDGRVRRLAGARSAQRDRAGLRPRLRSLRCRIPPAPPRRKSLRHARAAGRRCRGAGTAMDRPDRSEALVRVGAPVRRARSLRSATRFNTALRGKPLRRRNRRGGSRCGSSDPGSRRQRDRRGCRRSRRVARRSR